MVFDEAQAAPDSIEKSLVCKCFCEQLTKGRRDEYWLRSLVAGARDVAPSACHAVRHHFRKYQVATCAWMSCSASTVSLEGIHRAKLHENTDQAKLTFLHSLHSHISFLAPGDF